MGTAEKDLRLAAVAGEGGKETDAARASTTLLARTHPGALGRVGRLTPQQEIERATGGGLTGAFLEGEQEWRGRFRDLQVQARARPRM